MDGRSAPSGGLHSAPRAREGGARFLAALGRPARLLAAALAGAALSVGLFVTVFAAIVPAAPRLVFREALLYDAPGPRLIVDSGSNALYGFEAAALGRGLGRVGINAADNGGFDLLHKAYRLLALARPGDAVVLPLEWHSYAVTDRLTDTYLDAVATVLPGYFRALPALERVRVILAMPLPDAAGRLWANLGALVNRRREMRVRARIAQRFATFVGEGFDGGQETLPPRRLRPEAAAQTCDAYLFALLEGLRRPPDREGLGRVLAVLERLRARGVAIAFAPPVVAGEGCYDPPGFPAYVAEVRAALAERGFALLGDPQAFAFPAASALDTYYHVDREARSVATGQLLSLLRDAGFASPRAPDGALDDVPGAYARRYGLPLPR